MCLCFAPHRLTCSALWRSFRIARFAPAFTFQHLFVSGFRLVLRRGMPLRVDCYVLFGRGATECAGRQTETGFPGPRKRWFAMQRFRAAHNGAGNRATWRWSTRLKGRDGEPPARPLCEVGQQSANGAQTSSPEVPSHRHSKLRRARLRCGRRLVLTRVAPEKGHTPKRH